MFEGKVPVLVLPEKGLGNAAEPKRVIVAWNQSAEAMTATRLALPLLKAAQMVDITVVDPPPHGPERSDPGGLLCQMLVRHGVHAEVSVLARSLPRVSDVLARHIWDQNADLLVMGAYGHSRFREAILGGATRNMLEKAEIPVLMAH
jgi:nucleotide-binding universal stress UspA family protein